MSIHFKSIKYGYEFNVGFFFMDGPNQGDLSTFQNGDTVSLFWHITESQYNCINENIDKKEGVRAYCDSFALVKDKPGRFHTMIQFKVIERRRVLHFRSNDSMSLHDGGYSIILQAENGYWEDVFEWVVMGKKPTWADDEYE